MLPECSDFRECNPVSNLQHAAAAVSATGDRMTARSWPERLRASPELFPLDLEASTDTVAVLELPRIEYERASFLDGRLNRPAVLRPPFAELAQAAAGLPLACDYIFHVGHVGSTLLSRLLGFHPQVFALREPQALRTFATAEAPWTPAERARRLAVFIALYSRTWTPQQRALVKATSLVSDLAGLLLDLQPDARALMMTVSPATYLATILGGPNSRVELAAVAAARLARLGRRLGRDLGRVDDLSEGELAAASWACEMAALTAAAAAHPTRAAWIDFDRFLADPPAGLNAALDVLHGAAEPAAVARLMRSGFLERYSKAPTYPYGPDVRREVLETARREAGEEIRRGLAWLERAADAPAVAAALATAEGAGRGP
jgi:hypothetical protein